MRWLALGLFLLLLYLLLLLQYRLWFAEGSLAELRRLEAEVERQQQVNESLRVRNRTLEQEVLDLQRGLETVEERAREDLGMIREGETYYQVVDEQVVNEQVVNEQIVNEQIVNEHDAPPAGEDDDGS